MATWKIHVEIDDATAITIGRTVHPGGDSANPEACRRAFAKALPQFFARAVAARYAEALAQRASTRANDLATAVVVEYPDGYDPKISATPMAEPQGPVEDFTQGPAADPVATEPPPVVDPVPSPAIGD